MKKELICIVCEKKFYSTYKNKKCCDEVCKFKYYTLKYKEKRRSLGLLNNKKVCNYCGNEFFTDNKVINYCSDNCRKNFKIQYYTEKCNSGYFYEKFFKKGEGYLGLRFRVLKRDNFRCQYCGRNPRNDKDIILEIDHIIPRKLKGQNNINNLITSCLECNQGKGDVLLEQRKLTR